MRWKLYLHFILFYYIFIIPSPSPINVNIITHTNIIIGFVTRKVVVVTVLSRTFFQSNSKSLDQVSDEKKIKIKIYSKSSNLLLKRPYRYSSGVDIENR